MTLAGPHASRTSIPPRRPARRPSLPGFVALLWLGLVAAHAPVSRAETASGRVVDSETDEPIAGAWVFEAVPGERLAADVRRFRRVRETRTDAGGAFHFAAAPLGWLERLGSFFSEAPAPRYHVYHESYGLVWGREDAGTIRLRLRDAHLRQLDARALCGSTATDPLHARVRALACPPARPDTFPDGRPRATGLLDPRGRRIGPWTFYREDGSILARGRYVAGAASGKWRFLPRPSSDDD